ncbi:acyltransferase family protein [Sphingobium estronivorans]|uniref:acyltransferase family protein n=1 Tax=Sphingobium estronivorans TaxID=1577690 RepID=UPI00123C3F85|nr:acyltransferase family protein [Sphingobium estronivorans]
MTLDARADAARGYVLLGVFHLHILFALLKLAPDPSAFSASLLQIKLLAGHVSAFFFLGGMGARGLKRRTVESVAMQSVMLLLLAVLSHFGGFALNALIYGPPATLHDLLRTLVRPILHGTGYSTFVAWFFVVLAVIRPLAYLFERSRIGFAAAVTAIAIVIAYGESRHWPYNLYEWRNWPFAGLFFLMGMRLSRSWQVPAITGAGGLLLSLAAAWFNGPDLWRSGLCWTCNLNFLPYPMVGTAGFIPLALVQEVGFLLFLLWVSRLDRPVWPRRIARWFGRYSLQFLLLHGWVITAFYPLLIGALANQERHLLLAAVLLLNAPIHALLFHLLRPMLDRAIALCFSLSRGLVTRIPTLRLSVRTRIPAP